MKTILTIVSLLMIVGCASTQTSKKEVNKKVDKMIDTAWYQRTIRR